MGKCQVSSAVHVWAPPRKEIFPKIFVRLLINFSFNVSVAKKVFHKHSCSSFNEASIFYQKSNSHKDPLVPLLFQLLTIKVMFMWWRKMFPPFNFPLSSKAHFIDRMRYLSAHIFIFIEQRDGSSWFLGGNAIPHKKKESSRHKRKAIATLEQW